MLLLTAQTEEEGEVEEVEVEGKTDHFLFRCYSTSDRPVPASLNECHRCVKRDGSS